MLRDLLTSWLTMLAMPAMPLLQATSCALISIHWLSAVSVLILLTVLSALILLTVLAGAVAMNVMILLTVRLLAGAV